MEEAVARSSLWGLSHYTYGEAYFGSCRGMRYRLGREPLHIKDKDRDKITPLVKASVWPEPYAYGKTDASQITEKTFPFSGEGMEAACAWFNEQYHRHFA